MHWVIQDNLFRERGIDELINYLERHSISFSLHKVIPFVGDIQPDVDLNNPVIVMGAYSLRHVANKKGWNPGCFDLESFVYQDFIDHWGQNMLNFDSVYCAYGDVPQFIDEGTEFFIRPVKDSKFFAGEISTKEKFVPEWEKVVVLEEDNGSSLRASTEVMIAKPKTIYAEYRLWVVDGKIATYSLYKRGGRVLYRNEIDSDGVEFAEQMIAMWQPLRAFVMDVALTEDGWKIIELNTLNAAGLYAADVAKLVNALEESFNG